MRRARMSLPTPGSPRISKGTPGAARCAVPTRSRIRGVSRTVGTPVPPRADIFLPSLVRKEVRSSRAPSRANRPWGPKRPRMGVGELSGCRIDRSPERPTQEQTGKLSDGQRLVNSKFFGLDTRFPASSAMRPAQRIILAWIYAGIMTHRLSRSEKITQFSIPWPRASVTPCNFAIVDNGGNVDGGPHRRRGGLFSQGRVRRDEVLTD